MRINSLTGIATAIAMTASPVLAAPAFAAPNAGSSLTVAKSVRASTPSKSTNKLGGGAGIYAALIVAGIAAIVIIDAVKSDDSDSN